MSYSYKLNPQQMDAVLHTGSPLLILAGAGSGKTRVITYRIAHLINELHVAPANILGVTFTNKAANEMRQRIKKLVGKAARDLTLCTFHSLGLRILRTHAPKLKYRKDFTIYNEGDQLSLVRTLIREHERKRDKFDAGILLSRISRYKNTLIDGNPEPPYYNDKYDDIFLDIFEHYQRGLRACQAVDFDDLILLPIQLFKNDKDVLNSLQNQYRYIMVDEYQDTNHGQFCLISWLASKHRNLCAVGDDDQSIYGWRGAEVRNILEFTKDFSDAKIIKLEQNYRSTQVILDAAYYVIKNNYKRQEKRLWTQRDKGRNIDAFIANDENDEAKTIAWRIETIKEHCNARWDEFAILYRSNVQSRALETALRMAKIPYSVVGGYEFFERKEIKDLVAYLKVVLNPNNDLDLLRIINVPRRGIGNQSIVQLTEMADQAKKPIFDVLQQPQAIDSLTKSTQKGIHAFCDLINSLHGQLGKIQLKNLVAQVLENCGYKDELQRTIDDPIALQMKIETLEELVSAAASFSEDKPDASLTDFIDSISLGDEVGAGKDKKPHIENSVLLATLHSAKGLEFPYVFLCGMEEDILPHARSLTDNSEVDEERRLCYVGMTRAQNHLTLSLTKERNKFGKKVRRTPSRFLKEIPEEYMCKQFSHSVNFFHRQQIKTPEPKRETA